MAGVPDDLPPELGRSGSEFAIENAGENAGENGVLSFASE
jgi:hypothetical protein